jgi:hypothetical protein
LKRYLFLDVWPAPSKECGRCLLTKFGLTEFAATLFWRLVKDKQCLAFNYCTQRGDPAPDRGTIAKLFTPRKCEYIAMLRHSCGYKLANDGVDTSTIQGYLGHKSIQHTVRYTELALTRFKSLFRD